MLRPGGEVGSQRVWGRWGGGWGEGYQRQQQLGTCKDLAERENREPWEWQAVPGGWGWGVSVE